LLGEIYLQQQRPQEAIALYTAAHQLNPQDFRPVLAQAIVLKQQKQDIQAKPLFDQAVGLAPVAYKDAIKQMAVPVPGDTKSKN
jgi:cytochrome c-type biogenesis protein CcmH/NrfG